MLCRKQLNVLLTDYTETVRYAEFTPRPVNQAGAQGEEAGRRIANGGARQRRRRGKMHKQSLNAYRVAGGLWDYEIMMRGQYYAMIGC